MSKPTDSYLLDAAMEIAVVAMIREASLRRFLAEQGIHLPEFTEFRARNWGRIEAEVRSALDNEIAKALRSGKLDPDAIVETATRHRLGADPIADAAGKVSRRK